MMRGTGCYGGNGIYEGDEVTKYKAGDEVTIRLDDDDAKCLNSQIIQQCHITPKQIISHKKAPEPIVAYLNVFQNFSSNVYYKKELADYYGLGRTDCVKLTYNPSTKTATAEVVE